MSDVIETILEAAQVITNVTENPKVVIEGVDNVDIINVITTGPQGPPGEDGKDGTDGLGVLPDGNADGDILRWNETDQSWEVVSEPLEFSQIVLTPSEVAALNKEGSLWYKSTEKSIYVCTDEA